MISSDQLRRDRNHVYNQLDNVARMLDAVRGGERGYTSAVITMNCAAAENALEAALASVRKAKSEARLTAYQREQSNPLFAWPEHVARRASDRLPNVVSPALAG